LTNKGDFDRLLISEYANDDIVFLSRLANNEALYFHRETPPTDNKLERVMLVDISLKNWGTPKTMAHAVMLAIANHPKTEEVECSAFVVGDLFQSVKIDTINAVIDSLAYVDTCLYPTSGLEAFFKAKITDAGSEVFFMTTPSTLKNPDMMKTLTQYRSNINYLITCDLQGEIDIYKNRKGGRKHLQGIKLPLGELWSKKHQSKQAEEELSGDANYPILINYPIRKGQIIYDNYDVPYMITKEKKLLMSYSKFAEERRGFDIVYERLSMAHGTFQIGRTRNGDLMLLGYNPTAKLIMIWNLSTRENIGFPFAAPSEGGRRFFFYKDNFYLRSLGTKMTWRFDFQSNIELVKDGSVEYAFLERHNKEAQLNTANRALFADANVLKNIHRVYIDLEGNLVFNKHKLSVNQQGQIRISKSKGQGRICSATLVSDNIFKFDDGSEVEVNRSGLIILKSSHVNYSNIYIPSVLDLSIAVATRELFAGNSFYKKERMQKVILESAGSMRRKVVKTLKMELGITLKKGQETVNDLPQFLGIFKEDKAKQLLLALDSVGAKTSIKYVGSIQTEIEPQSFFSSYINNFVQHILSNNAT